MKWFTKLVLVVVSAAAVVLGMSGPAAAHEANTTAIEVSVNDAGLEAQVDLPIEELGDALGEEIATDTFSLSQTRELIVEYVTNNLHISSPDGAAWPLTVGQIRVIAGDGRDDVRVAVTGDNTTGATPDELVISSQAIIEHNDDHKIVVTVIESDGSARIAGFIDGDTDELTMSLNDDGSLDETSFVATLRYGFEHVLDGADHLLFLLTVLLPAPLVATTGRWRSAPGFWHGLRRVLHVATAFMVGHSISLAASAFGVVSLPSRPIEIAIAVSVGVSAIHAIRPITAHGEIPIAAGFGLVHGLAFAEILDGFGLTGGNTIVTLFAFNLGVELAQLVTIVVVFPAIWLLSRTSVSSAVRVAGASFALLLATVWTAERLGLGSNPLAFVEDFVVGHLGLIAIALVGAALVAANPFHAQSVSLSASAGDENGQPERSVAAG